MRFIWKSWQDLQEREREYWRRHDARKEAARAQENYHRAADNRRQYQKEQQWEFVRQKFEEASRREQARAEARKREKQEREQAQKRARAEARKREREEIEQRERERRRQIEAYWNGFPYLVITSLVIAGCAVGALYALSLTLAEIILAFSVISGILAGTVGLYAFSIFRKLDAPGPGV